MNTRLILGVGFTALIIYSISLIMTEVWVSQDFARNFFTDIDGPVPLYAINTTVSVFLLWATALIFAVCVVCTQEGEQQRKERGFYLSQILVFGYLGFDERFQVHERLGYVLGGPDYLVLLGVGVIELVLLLTLGNLKNQSNQAKYYLGLVALFFGLTLFIDGFVPPESVPRLSVEDLSKTWAGVFFFLFAWHIFYNKIDALKRKSGTTTG